ncbi:UNKNOWN [Stylonychia lemnae]|uniref:Uncharacterized protein n=1 Tax=Stylonychia lemnae TaxID=5949 RepID=A0A078A6P5_STYLE|nr:UNKNOWN [Stylonychia lemnae]|eukprot:CDW77869.1 UNKNOWN [Stylonychia lemnae]
MNQNSNRTLKDSLRSPTETHNSSGNEHSQGNNDFDSQANLTSNSQVAQSENRKFEGLNKESNMQSLPQNEQLIHLANQNSLLKQIDSQMTTFQQIQNNNKIVSSDVKQIHYGFNPSHKMTEMNGEDQYSSKQSLNNLQSNQLNRTKEELKTHDNALPISHQSAFTAPNKPSIFSQILQASQVGSQNGNMNAQNQGQSQTCPPFGKIPTNLDQCNQKQGFFSLISQPQFNISNESNSSLNTQHELRKRNDFLSSQQQSPGQVSTNQGRWNKQEHIRFLEALKLYGKNWRDVQKHVQTRSSTQARSHAQKFFVKLQRKGEVFEQFLDRLDISNLKNMPNEMIEYDDDDDVNDSTLGSKRNAPPVSVNQLEKKEGIAASKFKNDSSKQGNKKEKKLANQIEQFNHNTSENQNQIFKTTVQQQQQQQLLSEIKEEYPEKKKESDQESNMIQSSALKGFQTSIQANDKQIQIQKFLQLSDQIKFTQSQINQQNPTSQHIKNLINQGSQVASHENSSQPKDAQRIAASPAQQQKVGFQQVQQSAQKTAIPSAIIRPQSNHLGMAPQIQQQIMGGYPQPFGFSMQPYGGQMPYYQPMPIQYAIPGQLPFYAAGGQGIAPIIYNSYEDQIQQLFAQQTPIVFTQLDPNNQFQISLYGNQQMFFQDQMQQQQVHDLQSPQDPQAIMNQLNQHQINHQQQQQQLIQSQILLQQHQLQQNGQISAINAAHLLQQHQLNQQEQQIQQQNAQIKANNELQQQQQKQNAIQALTQESLGQFNKQPQQQTLQGQMTSIQNQQLMKDDQKLGNQPHLQQVHQMQTAQDTLQNQSGFYLQNGTLQSSLMQQQYTQPNIQQIPAQNAQLKQNQQQQQQQAQLVQQQLKIEQNAVDQQQQQALKVEEQNLFNKQQNLNSNGAIISNISQIADVQQQQQQQQLQHQV